MDEMMTSLALSVAIELGIISNYATRTVEGWMIAHK
jgi:hypothetical protein